MRGDAWGEVTKEKLHPADPAGSDQVDHWHHLDPHLLGELASEEKVVDVFHSFPSTALAKITERVLLWMIRRSFEFTAEFVGI